MLIIEQVCSTDNYHSSQASATGTHTGLLLEMAFPGMIGGILAAYWRTVGEVAALNTNLIKLSIIECMTRAHDFSLYFKG